MRAATYRDFVIEAVRKLADQNGFQVLPGAGRWKGRSVGWCPGAT